MNVCDVYNGMIETVTEFREVPCKADSKTLTLCYLVNEGSALIYGTLEITSKGGTEED